MGIDIAKLKSFAPSKQGIMNILTRIKRPTIKLPPIAIGMATLGILYFLVSFYVSWSGAATLAALESKLSSETVSVHVAPPPEEQDKHGFQNKHATKDKKNTFKLVKGLYKRTGEGKLPIIRRSDNLTSFRAYQAPFSFKDIGDKPLIAFIIQDFGLSQKNSEKALDILPPQVSFVLSPYAALPQEWLKMAKSKGHEVWLNIPIQNNTSPDLGPNTIFHHTALPKKAENMHASFSVALGYSGVASFTDNSMNRVKGHYLKIMDEIYARGLGFLELNPNASTTIEGKALTLGAPYIKSNMTVLRPKGNNSFQQLEKVAKKNGYAVAIVPNYPDSIKNLSVWILKVGQMDYAIAPISAIYDLPLHRAAPDIADTTKTLSPKDHEQPSQHSEHTPSKNDHH
ncbi:MAG: divergent polysaccharide deacetylase family protein [Alphaproteobacteria bacterium]